jgi:hypothetical protein
VPLQADRLLTLYKSNPFSYEKAGFLFMPQNKINLTYGKFISVPVEVKSGKERTLKSLHFFKDEMPHDFAVRLYTGEMQIINTITTSE